LNRYFDDKKKIEQVRGIFTGLSSVDNDEQGNKAVAEAMANPERYVLKPQREGHSIYIRTVRPYPLFNPIPTGHGRNQPIYECHVTTAGRNRVSGLFVCLFTSSSSTLSYQGLVRDLNGNENI
jgi:hypothetical protein